MAISRRAFLTTAGVGGVVAGGYYMTGGRLLGPWTRNAPETLAAVANGARLLLHNNENPLGPGARAIEAMQAALTDTTWPAARYGLPTGEVIEAPGRLEPARVQPDEPRVALVLECADRAIPQEEAEDGDDAQPESGKRGMDRERGRIGPDGRLQQDVEKRLVPDELCVRRQRPSGHVPARIGPRGERTIRGQREPRRDNPRRREQIVVFVDGQAVDDPQRRRVSEQRVEAVELEEPGTGRGEIHVPHRRKRHADDDLEPAAFGPHEHVGGDVGRDLVGPGRARHDG